MFTLSDLFKLLVVPFKFSVAGDDDGGTDRGDDFTPTGDEDDIPAEKDEEEEEEDEPEDKKDDGEEDDEDKGAGGKPRSKVIPRERFDAAQQKARDREARLQEQIERLQNSSTVAKTTQEIGELRDEIDKLSDQYEDLLLEGEKEKAREVRRKMISKQEQLYTVQSITASQASKRETIEELRYDSALAGYEAKYPVINIDHPDYDEEVATEVADLIGAFVLKGLTRAAALTKAVKYVVATQADVTDDRADSAKKAQKDRDVATRTKNSAANKAQPPKLNAGKDSNKLGAQEGGIDISRLTQDKFAKLDDETIARLRGDDI